MSDLTKDSPFKPMNTAHLEESINIQNHWMVRRCEHYEDELSACKSLSGKFQRYYVTGSAGDSTTCQNWKDNLADCKAWVSTKDKPAFDRIISREGDRIAARLSAHAANDVWERRSSPPDDWNKPLPKNLREMAEESKTVVYLRGFIKEEERKENQTFGQNLAASIYKMMGVE